MPEAFANQVAELAKRLVNDAVVDGCALPPTANYTGRCKPAQVLGEVGPGQSGELRQIADGDLARFVERSQDAKTGDVAEQGEMASGFLEQGFGNHLGIHITKCLCDQVLTFGRAGRAVMALTFRHELLFSSGRGDHDLSEMKLDVRHSTCQGGGAIYSLLGHIREIPQGGSIELMSDDYMAPIDVPAWVEKAGWQVWQVQGEGYETFVVQRPTKTGTQV